MYAVVQCFAMDAAAIEDDMNIIGYRRLRTHRGGDARSVLSMV